MEGILSCTFGVANNPCGLQHHQNATKPCRGEGFQLTRILSESLACVGCSGGDSDSAAAFFFRVLLAPPWERRAFAHYTQYFRCGWNPCVPVRTSDRSWHFCVAHVAQIEGSANNRGPRRIPCNICYVCQASHAIALLMSRLIPPGFLETFGLGFVARVAFESRIGGHPKCAAWVAHRMTSCSFAAIN